MHTIQLKHGNSYLQVQPGSTQVSTTPDGTSAWTHFAVHPGEATLESGSSISLRAHTGSYLQAANGGGGTVAAAGDRAHPWETFVLEKRNGPKALDFGEPVFLRSHTGHYLTLSGNTLAANTTDPQAATPFTVRFLKQLRPFNMVVLGDSVAWGQGLKESDKYDTQVEGWLEQKLGRQVHRYRLAHSGANVMHDDEDAAHYAGHDAPLFPGELPYSNPSIQEQAVKAVGRLWAQHKLHRKNVDFVLMNGGINTVNVTSGLLNPLSGVNQVISKTQKAGEQLRTTVAEVLQHFPRAKVILTTYYPIISSASPVWVLDLLASAFATTGFMLPAIATSHVLLQILNLQCKAFNAEMTRQMRSIAETHRTGWPSRSPASARSMRWALQTASSGAWGSTTRAPWTMCSRSA